MRLIIFVAGLGMALWSSPEFMQWSEELVLGRPDPHAVAAIELRCAEETDAFRDDCAQELQKTFDLGVRQPEEILRLHCTRYTNEWALDPVAPPNICREMYGGWIES